MSKREQHMFCGISYIKEYVSKAFEFRDKEYYTANVDSKIIFCFSNQYQKEDVYSTIQTKCVSSYKNLSSLYPPPRKPNIENK